MFPAEQCSPELSIWVIWLVKRDEVRNRPRPIQALPRQFIQRCWASPHPRNLLWRTHDRQRQTAEVPDLLHLASIRSSCLIRIKNWAAFFYSCLCAVSFTTLQTRCHIMLYNMRQEVLYVATFNADIPQESNHSLTILSLHVQMTFIFILWPAYVYVYVCISCIF